MEPDKIRELLLKVQQGELSIDKAVNALRLLPFEDLGFAKIDHHRALRTGFPEVIYCHGKSVEHIAALVQHMRERQSTILATRASAEVATAIASVEPSAQYHAAARMVVICPHSASPEEPLILIITAGTADIPVAEEAAVTAESLGGRVERVYDVGVAGIHRLLEHQNRLAQADVIIVVAGMEGALPSVVTGLVDVPVIAVPTSVGYGASFEGLAPLLTMLNSCASGVVVVNIDNGFGAGYFARLLTRQITKGRA